MSEEIKPEVIKRTQDILGFDEADPLADLLSDEDSLGSKKEVNQKTSAYLVKPDSLGVPESRFDVEVPTAGATKRDKSNVISDLFGLGSDDTEVEPSALLSSIGRDEDKDNQISSKRSIDWLGIKSPAKVLTANVVQAAVAQSKVKTGIKNPVSPKKTSSLIAKTEDYSDDMLGKMGFNDSNVSEMLDLSLGKEGPGSLKQKSLLNDLFGGSVSDTSKSVGVLNSPEKKISKDQIGNPVSFGSYAPSVTAVREPRRSASKHASSLADPLGLFSSSQAVVQDPAVEVSSMAAASSNKLNLSLGKIPVQLEPSSDSGAATSVSAPSSQPPGHLAASAANLPEWLGGRAFVAEKPSTHTEHVHEPSMHLPAEGTHSVHHLQGDNDEMPGPPLLAGARLNQELVASLQRQEAQLVAALQAKQCHDQLATMHWRHNEVLQRQEKQLMDLVERQGERQRQFEDQLIRQQERISSHIQALMSQPVGSLPAEVPVVGTTGVAATPSSLTPDVGAHTQAAGLDANARYKEELTRVEDFYKHHIALLESSLERLEARLRAENVRLEEEYQARIAKLQEEVQLLEDAHRQKVAALQEEQLADLKHLKELYQREVDDLRQHYTRVAAVEQDNSSQARSLQLLCEQLGQNSAQLISLKEKMDGRQHSQLDVRDAALQAKEVELKAARDTLQRQQVAFEKERKRLVQLVADLELRGAERQGEIDTRAWELRQEAAKVEACTLALEAERQRSQTRLEQERQQLLQLRQSLLEEQKRTSQQVREEKLKLSAEKSRLEAVAQLQGSATPAIMADVEQVRAEAEAAMQVALDSIQRAETEREKVAEQKRQLAAEHRRLQEMERKLAVRSQELHILEEVAAATKEEGLQALKECHDLPQQLATRTAEYQQQVFQLKEREHRLAEEKMALSRERQALQKRKGQDLFCSLCKVLLGHSGASAAASVEPSQKFVDPEQVILRLAGERDLDDISHSNLASSFISK